MSAEAKKFDSSVVENFIFGLRLMDPLHIYRIERTKITRPGQPEETNYYIVSRKGVTSLVFNHGGKDAETPEDSVVMKTGLGEIDVERAIEGLKTIEEIAASMYGLSSFLTTSWQIQNDVYNPFVINVAMPNRMTKMAHVTLTAELSEEDLAQKTLATYFGEYMNLLGSAKRALRELK